MLTKLRFEDLKNNENVKTAVEHISLYVGLVVFTALGAKVGIEHFAKKTRFFAIFSLINVRICEINFDFFGAKIKIWKKSRNCQYQEFLDGKVNTK